MSSGRLGRLVRVLRAAVWGGTAAAVAVGGREASLATALGIATDMALSLPVSPRGGRPRALGHLLLMWSAIGLAGAATRHFAGVLVLLVPLLALLAGIALLEFDRAIALWLAVAATAVPAALLPAWSNDGPPHVAWRYALLAAGSIVATLPLMLYIKESARPSARHALPWERINALSRIGIVAAVVAIASGIGQLAAVSAARESRSSLFQAAFAGSERSLTAVSDELESRFTRADVRSADPGVCHALLHWAAVSDLDLFVFDRSARDGRGLIAGATHVRDDPSKILLLTGERALDPDRLRTLRAMIEEPPSYAWIWCSWPRGGWPPVSRGLFPEGGRPRSKDGPRTLATYPGTGSSSDPLVLLGTRAAAGGLWRSTWFADLAALSGGQLFPWLFLGLFCPSTAMLVILGRRDRLAAQLLKADERERLNRDAHDKVYNRLSALSKRAQIAALGMGARGRTALSQIAEDIRGTVIELQSILGGDGVTVPARPREEEGGPPLLAQLGQVCTGRAARLGLAIDLTCDTPALPVPPLVGWEIQCVLEEALTNARLHGGARRVEVNAAFQHGDGPRFVLFIDDDGGGLPAGFSVDDLPAHHQGVRNMCGRADRLGGTATIAGLPSGGVRVTLDVPLAS